MYKEDLALNYLQYLICHKTQLNTTKRRLFRGQNRQNSKISINESESTTKISEKFTIYIYIYIKKFPVIKCI